MHCMLMDLLHGFEVLSTTEETLFNNRNVSRLVQNKNMLSDALIISIGDVSGVNVCVMTLCVCVCVCECVC